MERNRENCGVVIFPKEIFVDIRDKIKERFEQGIVVIPEESACMQN